MANPEPALAKLTRPRLYGAAARTRLFERLDLERQRRAAVCVVGPPGAGKTTLVASWLDARKRPGIWYQVDPGDTDLATFFYYLGRAAHPFGRRGQRALPAFTPEYLHDAAGFSRRFFRELFARLPAGATLVLDNYQEVDATQRFHQLVADAVVEVPAERTLVVVSRRDPPDCYARLFANENVAVVDWDELRLTEEEALAIAAQRGETDAERVRALHAQADGWAAGYTLLMERKRSGDGAGLAGGAGTSRVFDYFAAQTFEQASPELRHFLACTGFLSSVPVSVARELSGSDQAHEILESLHRRNLFTHRRPGEEPTYVYHALFQAFLKTQAPQVLGPERLREVQLRAARLLEASARADEAFALFRAAGEWESAARLIQCNAAALLAHGRGATVREWIGALPDELRERNPWLQYWLGTASIAHDQSRARAWLERAYDGFVELNDLEWQALAAAGVIDSWYFEWSDFGPMRRWVDALEPALDRLRYVSARDWELRVQSSLLVGILYSAPGHRLLPRCVARVTEMLDENVDVNARLRAATFLLSYANLASDLDLAASVVARGSPWAAHPDATPLNQMWWYLRSGYYWFLVADYRRCSTTLAQAREVAQAHGLEGLRSARLLQLSYESVLHSQERDVPALLREIEQMEALADPQRPMDRFHPTQNRMYLACVRREPRALVDLGAATIAAAVPTGMVYIEILARLHQLHGLAELGRATQFEESVQQVRALIAGTCFAFFEAELRFLEAYFGLRWDGDDSARRVLAEALRYASTHDYAYNNMFRFSSISSALLAEALAAGIEPDYVCDVIRRYRIRPSVKAPEQWPWPVRVYTLGRFEIRIDDVPLRFTGKTPRKPLALLRAIVALGGADVPLGRLADLIWGEEEGDSAAKALSVALLRLRKLLGDSDTLLVTDEQVTLNPALVWVDAWAFEGVADRLEAQSLEHQAGGLPRMLDDLLGLYRGNFLPNDADAPWAVKQRLRLRGMFARVVEHIGAQLENAGEWERARACYQRGLETDELAEAFYLGMMRCYRALNRPAEGIAVFRRLRQTLSVVLGVVPSLAAEELARELRACASITSA
jgi:DNA-binding SARP family transcriptional activator